MIKVLLLTHWITITEGSDIKILIYAKIIWKSVINKCLNDLAKKAKRQRREHWKSNALIKHSLREYHFRFFSSQERVIFMLKLSSNLNRFTCRKTERNEVLTNLSSAWDKKLIKALLLTHWITVAEGSHIQLLIYAKVILKEEFCF